MQGYEALVRKVQQAEGKAREDAFGELIVQFDSVAHGWAYNLLGDVHTAQDVVQDAFITAYQKIDDLHEPAAFPAWLKRIVLTYSHRRTRRKTPSLLPLEDEAQVSAPVSDPAVTHEDRELKEQVNRAVRALPEHERVVTELFYITGYSQREIAERLALPLTTVKKRLQYAREHLRETMPPLNVLYHQRIDAEMDGDLLRLLMLIYPDLLAVA